MRILVEPPAGTNLSSGAMGKNRDGCGKQNGPSTIRAELPDELIETEEIFAKPSGVLRNMVGYNKSHRCTCFWR